MKDAVDLLNERIAGLEAQLAEKDAEIAMSEEQERKTPLIDLLRSVPTAARGEWPIQFDENRRATGHAMTPYGRLCPEAADCIAELHQKLAEKDAEIARLQQQKEDAYKEVEIQVAEMARMQKGVISVEEALAPLVEYQKSLNAENARLREENEKLKDENAGLSAAADSLHMDVMSLQENSDD